MNALNAASFSIQHLREPKTGGKSHPACNLQGQDSVEVIVVVSGWWWSVVTSSSATTTTSTTVSLGHWNPNNTVNEHSNKNQKD